MRYFIGGGAQCAPPLSNRVNTLFGGLTIITILHESFIISITCIGITGVNFAEEPTWIHRYTHNQQFSLKCPKNIAGLFQSTPSSCRYWTHVSVTPLVFSPATLHKLRCPGWCEMSNCRSRDVRRSTVPGYISASTVILSHSVTSMGETGVNEISQ